MVNKEIRAVAITDTGIFTDSNKTAQFVSAKKQIEVAVDKKEPSDEKAKELLVVQKIGTRKGDVTEGGKNKSDKETNILHKDDFKDSQVVSSHAPKSKEVATQTNFKENAQDEQVKEPYLENKVKVNDLAAKETPFSAAKDGITVGTRDANGKNDAVQIVVHDKKRTDGEHSVQVDNKEIAFHEEQLKLAQASITNILKAAVKPLCYTDYIRSGKNFDVSTNHAFSFVKERLYISFPTETKAYRCRFAIE